MNNIKNIRPFLSDNFLLYSDSAAALYFDYAEKMPIIDYHNHLPPQQIAQDHQFKTITEVWLAGDHYKWRAMRTHGISEEYITGNKSDEEKFFKWAETVPYTLRNPLFHWTHLELKRYFNIDKLLLNTTAADIYNECNALLQTPEYSVKGLLKKANVRVVCTTDDPADTLEYHQIYAQQGDNSLKMYPSFRPDKYILIENDQYATHVQKLAVAANMTIDSYDSLLEALWKRAQYFKTLGCRASDHGLNYVSAVEYKPSEVKKIFADALAGKKITAINQEKFKSAILIDLGKMYYQLGWVQQWHLGALRNNNLRALRILGMDTGWDSIGDWSQASNLSKFLGKLDQDNTLAKTIIYNLNPADNEVMASMIGNFNDGSIKGKIQYGSAWWFLDQKDGMEKQINALSNMGLLSCFIGMLTDSRSFLSFPRHEYFRRILCNILGNEMEKGEIPSDIAWVGKIVQDICYTNAEAYFKF